MYQRLAMPRLNPKSVSGQCPPGASGRRPDRKPRSRVAGLQSDSSVVTIQAITWSQTRKNTLTSATKTSTMIDEMIVSLRVGHVILETSVRTCWKKVMGFVSAIGTTLLPEIEANVQQPRESSRGWCGRI